MRNEKRYNGWKNYETWNVMLWINGTENLYFTLVDIKEEYKRQNKKLSYKKFINEINFQNEQTGDGVEFINYKLSYRELNEAIQEVA